MDSHDKWFGVYPHTSVVIYGSPLRGGLRGPGMKEGCSGENVLERER